MMLRLKYYVAARLYISNLHTYTQKEKEIKSIWKYLNILETLLYHTSIKQEHIPIWSWDHCEPVSLGIAHQTPHSSWCSPIKKKKKSLQRNNLRKVKYVAWLSHSDFHLVLGIITFYGLKGQGEAKRPDDIV